MQQGLHALASVTSRARLPYLSHLTLKDTNFKKAQLEVLLRALLEGQCPLEELELSGTALCLSAPGRFCLDALQLVCALVSRPHSALREMRRLSTSSPTLTVAEIAVRDGRRCEWQRGRAAQPQNNMQVPAQNESGKAGRRTAESNDRSAYSEETRARGVWPRETSCVLDARGATRRGPP